MTIVRTLWTRPILWVDSASALVTGLGLLALSEPIGAFLGIRGAWVTGHAFVHLAYGSYSGSLALRNTRPRWAIHLLIFANAAWALFCLAAALALARPISGWWAAQLAFEGAFIGALAAIEWTLREQLRTRRAAPTESSGSTSRA